MKTGSSCQRQVENFGKNVQRGVPFLTGGPDQFLYFITVTFDFTHHLCCWASSSRAAITLCSMATTSIDTSALWTLLAAKRPLPLRFSLHLSRRPNSSLCPCLQLSLTPTLTLTRILDPEHRVPYITLSPLLHSAGLTLIQGLLRFQLSPTSFDLSLAGLEPWDDLWISLPLARTVAAELGLASVLAAILDSRTNLAWSLDEFEAGLAHNWRVPGVNVAGYSTDAITSVQFERAQMLPQGQQIKTLISADLRRRVKREAEERKASRAFQVHQRLVRWSAQVYGFWQDLQVVREDKTDVKKAIFGDLMEVVLAPTQTDVLEWTGFISPNLEWERDLWTPPSLTEIAGLRRSEKTLGQSVRSEDLEGGVKQLEAILHAKVALLHRMNLLSLPHLGPSVVTEQIEPPLSLAAFSKTQSAQTPAARTDDEIAQLHAKLDTLTSKMDALLAASTRPFHRQTSVKSQFIPPFQLLPTSPIRFLSILPPPVLIVFASILTIIVIKSTLD